MKVSYRMYILVMLILLFIPMMFALIFPQKKYSFNENRYLNKFPKFSFSDVISGEFQEKFVSAYNDQFILRDFMMEVSTAVKKAEGCRDINGVYIGKENYYITKVTDRDVKREKFIGNLRYVEYFADRQEVPVYTMLVPSAGNILNDKLPLMAQMYNIDEMYNTISTVLDSSDLIDVREELNQQKISTQVYFKTDHHWTLQGAYAAYGRFCLNNGLRKHSYGLFSPRKVSGSFYGTVYSKVLDFSAKPDNIYAIAVNEEQVSVICDGEKGSVYDESKLETKDKYAYFFGGNYGRVDIKTGNKDKPKLLVIKDSYANSFVPFLFEYYSEITMIDPRYYNESVLDLAGKNNYNEMLILYEMSNFIEDNNLSKLTIEIKN